MTENSLKIYHFVKKIGLGLKWIGLQWEYFPKLFQIQIKTIELCHLDILMKQLFGGKKVDKGLRSYEIFYFVLEHFINCYIDIIMLCWLIYLTLVNNIYE
jgi:hypothetical protein